MINTKIKLRSYLLLSLRMGLVIGFIIGIFKGIDSSIRFIEFSLYNITLETIIDNINHFTLLTVFYILIVSLILYANNYLIKGKGKLFSICFIMGGVILFAFFLKIKGIINNQFDFIYLIVILCLGGIFYLLSQFSDSNNKIFNLLSKIFNKKIVAISFVLLIGSNASIYINKLINKPKGPNIIFISIDALRSDHLGCYGYMRNTSPNIDQFAKEGILFKNAISQAPWTLPSFWSLMVSQYLDVRNGNANIPRITLAEYLKNMGYTTIAFSDDALVSRQYGFHMGFDTFDEETKRGIEKARDKIGYLLEKNVNEIFFLFIYSLDVHGPYKSPSPYNRMFMGDKLYNKNKKVKLSKHRSDIFNAIPAYVNDNNINDIDYYISQYDGCIRYTDTQLGLLFKKLKDLNLYNDSLIIFTADHGESLGEHSVYFQHAISLYDNVIKVPLIIKFPEFKSKVILPQVQLIDIMPTILSIVGYPINYQDQRIQGKSFLPLILQNKKILHPYVVSSGGMLKQYAIRTEKWKLIYKVPGLCKEGRDHIWLSCPDSDLTNRHKIVIELYNIKDDRQELNNLIDQESAIALELMVKLFSWLESKGFFQYDTGMEEMIEINKLDNETIEKLRLLGYL